MTQARWLVLGFTIGIFAAIAPACGGGPVASKCNQGTCPSGCCNGDKCETGSSQSACGTNGKACSTCGGGQQC